MDEFAGLNGVESMISHPTIMWNAFHTIERYPFGNGTPNNVLEIHTIELSTNPHYYMMVDLHTNEDYAFHTAPCRTPAKKCYTLQVCNLTKLACLAIHPSISIKKFLNKS